MHKRHTSCHTTTACFQLIHKLFIPQSPLHTSQLQPQNSWPQQNALHTFPTSNLQHLVIYFTTTNVDASSNPTGRLTLLGAPTEIRLQIYEILMMSNADINLAPGNGGKQALSSQLLTTCHQIHRKASYILYGRSIFTLCPAHLDTLRKALAEHNMSQMRTLKMLTLPQSPSFDPSSEEVFGAVISAKFSRGLRLLECKLTRLDSHNGPSKNMRGVYWFLERLIDHSDLPQLDRMSDRECKDIGTSEHYLFQWPYNTNFYT